MKLTLRRNVSFDMKTVIDGSKVKEQLDFLKARIDAGEVTPEAVTKKRFAQALHMVKLYDEQGLEAATDYVIQQSFRDFLEGQLKNISSVDGEYQNDSFSPIKFTVLPTGVKA